jgi:hypothetical protein
MNNIFDYYEVIKLQNDFDNENQQLAKLEIAYEILV